MTVKELIEKLQALPPEAQEKEVNVSFKVTDNYTGQEYEDEAALDIEDVGYVADIGHLVWLNAQAFDLSGFQGL